MTLMTYLFFDGKCGEAFDFYREVFGGEFAHRLTNADAPADIPVNRSDPDRIMHVALPIGESLLMGSDTQGAGGALGLLDLLCSRFSRRCRYETCCSDGRRRQRDDAHGRRFLGQLFRRGQ